jgi:hypothetical protein
MTSSCTHQPSGLFVAGADLFTGSATSSPDARISCRTATNFGPLPPASCGRGQVVADGTEFIVHLGSDCTICDPPIHPFRKPLQVRHASLQPFYSLFSRLRRHQQHSGGLVRQRSPPTAQWRLAGYVPDDDTIVVLDRACSDAAALNLCLPGRRDASDSGHACDQCRISCADFLDGCSLHSSATIFSQAPSMPRTRIVARVQARDDYKLT